MTFIRPTRDINTAISDLIDPNQFRLDLGEPKKTLKAKAEDKLRRAKGLPTNKVGKNRLPLAMRTLEGALKVLRNMGYTYVVEKAGDTSEVYKHGTLTSIESLMPAKGAKKKKTFAYPRGYVGAHVLPFMQNMSVGDCVEIPSLHADGTRISLYNLQSTVCNIANVQWGKGSATTSMNPKTKTVEVLRLA